MAKESKFLPKIEVENEPPKAPAGLVQTIRNPRTGELEIVGQQKGENDNAKDSQTHSHRDQD